ncbi:diguanylate cyclase (GGDEF)-like protein [Herbaspirillum sp. Sphag1AN]|uniref:putative bifunctional diguanylate cyclase/phosphodiesterase n=1 Tax=unclassified Herbaspirillum TaxID=2624150 RepID=UPI001620CC42|nr:MULTISPECIES: EAL domain-containing protein [unclassified Herbaspirillum]MBB3214711.1 diguanylate cyclase (GGDEF)-like protein [Herbaspirillum sp. Sphag1AN]MBB3247886.1 diguanylate cyclase (GGDEF)-like protein [Herbaspirillum sp. Sphag64]
MFTANYDSILVILSYTVAVLASYTALDVSGRIHSAQKNSILWWQAGGAIAMGMGIWSMHFIGMLAFRLPIPLGYDWKITALSLSIAVLASGFALWRINQPQLSRTHLATSAIIMGISIATMHYTGMAAMRMNPAIQYDIPLFIVSVVIAIVAAGAALWIAFNLRKNTRRVRLLRGAASLVMGAAIVGMHYTGMAAANFPLDSVCTAANDGIGPGWLAVVVIVVTLAVLTIALLTSVLDARLESQTAQLARSLAEANSELQKQALHDGLTNLANRSLLEDRLEQMLNKATREKSRFAFMFIDLDGFKAINDSLGHHVGDQLLIAVAARICNSLRAQDTVARLGGDEFVILTEIVDPEDVAPIAGQLVTVIHQPFQIGKHDLRISASIGVAIFPEDGSTSHDLMVNADAAMYFTKGTGRNGYHFFATSMNVNVHHQLQLIQDIHSALEHREFYLNYQPKFSVPTGKITGAEALIRWQHPTRGVIAPNDFIPIAEKTGLIIAIGEWVLNEACRQMREWYEAGHQDWKMAVNLSAVQFRQEGLLDLVKSTLLHHHLPPHCLILEVTESTAMHDVEASLLILDSLVALGVDISIDDFGTGYSSLLYLKRMPASELKIDRGFIHQLAQGTDDAAIVSAIVGLGQSLNLRIVAEGVETESQHNFLTTLGCNTLQGYLMGRPMSPEQFINAIAAISTSTISADAPAISPDLDIQA